MIAAEVLSLTRERRRGGEGRGRRRAEGGRGGEEAGREID